MVAPDLNLGIHSYRVSGASAAANADGVTDRCIKRYGRWRSDPAKDGYIKDSLEKKNFISQRFWIYRVVCECKKSTFYAFINLA